MSITHRHARPLIYLSLLLCAACDALPVLPTFATEEAPATGHAAPATSAATVHAPTTAAPVPGETANAAAPPEAVYILEMGKNTLPDSVEQSLRGIAEHMKSKRDLVIRLDSYVPDSGSRELNIGLSRQVAASIQRRLIELGVPSYRIKPSTLGAEYPGAIRLEQRRVELFLLPLPR